MTMRIGLLIAVLGIFVVASVGMAADGQAPQETKIGALPWNDSNFETLSSFDKGEVADFLKSQGVDWYSQDITAQDIKDVTWAKLAGNSQYYLVIVFYPPGTSGENELSIYSKEPSGHISSQSIVGMGMSLDGANERAYIPMPPVIQDLEGNGKEELVVPVFFHYLSAVWPKVYRLENGTYVDAS